jgi:hypothetical protein
MIFLKNFLAQISKLVIHLSIIICVLKNINQSMIIAYSYSDPILNRIKAILRAICCTFALVLAYITSLIKNPQLEAAFRVCCVLFTSAYILLNGEISIAMGLLAIANKKIPLIE